MTRPDRSAGGRIRGVPPTTPACPGYPHDRLIAERDAAHRRLEGMLAKGQKEATELNKEYDRLQQKALDAVEELETFKRDKLGMKDEEEAAEQAS